MTKLTSKSLLAILFIVVIFVLSYLATDHLSNSYILNEPKYVTELESSVDSLKSVIKDKDERINDLKSDIDDLTEKVKGEENE